MRKIPHYHQFFCNSTPAQRNAYYACFRRVWYAFLLFLFFVSCGTTYHEKRTKTITDEDIVTIFENLFITDHYADSGLLMQYVDSLEQHYGTQDIFQSIRYKVLGHHHYRYGRYALSEQYFDSALVISRKHQKTYPKYHILALNNASEVANRLLKFDEATSYIIEVIYHTRDENSPPDLYNHAARLFQLANILYNKESHIESIDFLHECIVALRSYKPMEEQDVYNNIFLQFHAQKLLANNFTLIRMYDSVYTALNQAILLIDSILKLDPESNPYIQISKAELDLTYSKLYIQNENFLSADSILHNVLSSTADVHYFKKLRFRAYSLLALSFVKQNKVADALKIISDLEETSSAYISVKDKITAEFFDIKSQVCAAAGNFACAFKYKSISSEILDSISTKILLSNKVNATREYLNLLNTISEEKYLSKIQRNTFILFIISIFSAALLIILTMLYRQTVKNKNHLKQERFLSSELAKKNEELTDVIEQLKESQLHNKFLLKHIAHDLRNPLSNIKGIAEIAQSEHTSNSENHYFNLIEKQASTSLNFIHYLLNSSSGVAVKELHCLNDIVENSIQSNYQLAQQKDIEIDKFYSQKYYCYVDNYKIWSLLNNLISNAIKFSERGGIIRIRLTHIDKDVSITVTDYGIGMPASYIEKILSDEKPKGREGTEGETSYGIGLWLCKQIVKEHDGRFNILSEEGKGSTFVVILPCGSIYGDIENVNNPMGTLEIS